MGCSNPHPHGQIWANSTVPTLPAQEAERQHDYLKRRGRCLLCAYLETELREQSRIVFANDSFAALVPFWAVWPFETMILPRRHALSILDLTAREKRDLAGIMIRLGTCYDNLFQTSFPYSMGIHQQPTNGRDHPHWHWHIHYLPPLLRSQSVRKHMVGYELLAMPQRDLTAESAAERLRALPDRHYLEESE
jgi:UDPglucose--hexose-1-phosphate uridylyltransferase